MSKQSANRPKRKAPRSAWPKGVSGNPRGRPAVPKEVTEAARAYSMTAICVLARWTKSKNGVAAVRAAQALLDRGWGSAPQKIELGGGEEPLEVRSSPTPESVARLREMLLGATPQAPALIPTVRVLEKPDAGSNGGNGDGKH